MTASVVRIGKFLLIAPFILCLAGLCIFPKWTVDDAFITYRYAENLARHGELTWNIGEEPVEGYTGVALPVLLAGLIQTGVQPVAVAKVMGALSHLARGLLLFMVLRRMGAGRTASCLVL